MNSGEFHSGRGRWTRAQYQCPEESKEKHPEHKNHYICPYEDCDLAFATMANLVRHINTVITKGDVPDNESHFRLVEEDGWLDPDFAGVISVVRAAQREQEKLIELSAYVDVRVPQYHAVTPDPDLPHVWRGDFHSSTKLKSNPMSGTGLIS